MKTQKKESHRGIRFADKGPMDKQSDLVYNSLSVGGSAVERGA